MRVINILGSTGSIGTQALQIAALHPDKFKINALTAHRSVDALFAQVRAFRPRMAGLTGMTADEVEIPQELHFCDWHFGQDALLTAARDVPCDDVLVSVVGMVGLPAVMAARGANRRVLLANKEALVAGGRIVMAACPEDDGNPTLIPVDSEHSAIYQCLKGAQGNPYARILLTASGGAFRNYTLEQLQNATLAQALTHPNWSMGAKITIDSATMMNKGLELIEAMWLYDLPPEDIEIVVHRESIVHSAVEFADGAVIAQLGLPDMRLPIQLALTWPQRVPCKVPRMSLAEVAKLTFYAPDYEAFPALNLAKQAAALKGDRGAVLNGANEAAVGLFLDGRIGFTEIAERVSHALDSIPYRKDITLDDVLAADRAARELVLG